jgi:glycogen(starch) synthase
VQEGTVIYNGRDASLFFEREKEDFVFSMGRVWDEAKNIKLLTEAAPLIDASVKIAGDNQFAQNVFRQSADHVKYLGKLSTQKIAQQLSTASVYVLPAKYEPFGLSALEAALSGCALVLGDIPSLREIWQDAALYVHTDSAQELAHTVNGLMKNKNLLDKQRQKAKARAQRFSSEATTESYRSQYRQLVQRKIPVPQNAIL